MQMFVEVLYLFRSHLVVTNGGLLLICTDFGAVAITLKYKLHITRYGRMNWRGIFTGSLGSEFLLSVFLFVTLVADLRCCRVLGKTK